MKELSLLFDNHVGRVTKELSREVRAANEIEANLRVVSVNRTATLLNLPRHLVSPQRSSSVHPTIHQIQAGLGDHSYPTSQRRWERTVHCSLQPVAKRGQRQFKESSLKIRWIRPF